MSNVEYRAVKFFTRKGLNAIEISKDLDSVYKDDAQSYAPSPNGFAEFTDSERGFEDSPRTGHLSIITTDQNIEAVEQIVMRDQQVSVHRVAYEWLFQQQQFMRSGVII